MVAYGKAPGGPDHASEHVREGKEGLAGGVPLGCPNAQRRFAAWGDLNGGSTSTNEELGNLPFVQGDGGHERRPSIVKPWFDPMLEATGEESSHPLAGPCVDGELKLS